MARANTSNIESCQIPLSTNTLFIKFSCYMVLNLMYCNAIIWNSEPYESNPSNCVGQSLAFGMGCLTSAVISPNSLSFPLRVCVCAYVAEKGNSLQNSGRRCTGGAREMKSITSSWKKVLFLLNMKGRVLPMPLSMHTKSMFLLPVENFINQSIRPVSISFPKCCPFWCS